MNLKSLVLLAASTPTLAFAQENYQTQYIPNGTNEEERVAETPPGQLIPPPEAVYNAEYRIQEVQIIKENVAPNAQP